MYDPVIALFISADSIIPDLYDPQSLNRYTYCRNNPLKYVDPDGHAYDLIDIGFFVQSAYTFARNPSWANAGWLAADTVSLAPIVPSLGYGRVATKIAGKVADVASNANKAENSAKSLKALENASKNIAANRAKGAIGEVNSGVTKNTTRIPSASGKKAYRIPDGMDDAQRHLQEVKNVNKQGLTSQLKDDVAHATRGGGQGQVDAIVDQRTRLSKPLKNANADSSDPINVIRKDLN